MVHVGSDNIDQSVHNLLYVIPFKIQLKLPEQTV